MRGEVGEDAGVDDVAEGLAGLGGAAEEVGRLVAGGVEVGGGQALAGALGRGGPALEDPLLEDGGEAAGGLAEAAFEEFDDGLGEGQLALGVDRVGRGEVVGDEEQRHVADDLGRRRDLDDVAEEDG